jgi:hypothetical protein
MMVRPRYAHTPSCGQEQKLRRSSSSIFSSAYHQIYSVPEQMLLMQSGTSSKRNKAELSALSAPTSSIDTAQCDDITN